MPTREKYRRDDKENQLLAAFIQIKTWIQPGFKVEITPLVICTFGGGIKKMLKKLENTFEKDLCERIVAELQKTTLMDSETKCCQDSSKVTE